MSVIEIIAGSSYITFSKPIAKKYGINEAILLGSLCSMQLRYGNEEFYCEQSRLMEDTCLTEYGIRQATKTLKDNGLISITKRGLPARYFYKVNEDKLLEEVCRGTSGCEFNTTGDCEKSTTYNNNRINNNKLIIKEKEKTIDDVLGTIEDSSLKAKLQQFIKHRKAIKKPMTTYALELLIKKLSTMGNVYKQLRILDQSIENGWQGVFELKEQTKRVTDKQYSQEELDSFFSNLDDVEV